MNESEKKDGTLPVVTAKTTEKSVTVIKGKGRKQSKSSYSFDNVFTAFSTQEEVFEATVKPVIMDVMRGFESTVFAYGQTGTGKTHTMEGSLSSPELYGVIPRSAQAIFELLKQPRYKEHKVTCSYLEIYNEELRDLLVDNDGTGSRCNTPGSYSPGRMGQQGGKLDIMESKSGTFCRGLVETQVHSASDVFNLMQKAQHSRHIGETKMNKASSRSHCLFTIQVHGKLTLMNGDGEMKFNGKLHMVDLAGSECAKSAGNDKGAPDAVARERERMNINRSLLTLGRVITVLKEKVSGKNTSARIPYRDSKLTRVLQESLGGRCKTIIVATLSPSITAIEESLSTLNYAHSANGIVNKPVSSSLIALSENMTPSMSSDSKSSPAPTIESWQEMDMRLQYMQAQVDEAQAALARKHLQQQELQDRAEKFETELLESQQKLYDVKNEIKTLKVVVEDETNRRKETEKELHETQIHLKKTEMILKVTQATESSLTVEAQTLIDKLEEIISDRNDMHTLVVSQREAESQQKEATKLFQKAVLAVLNNIDSSFTNLVTDIETGSSSAIKIATLNHEVGRNSVSETQKLLSEISKNVSCVTDSIKAQLAGEGGIVPVLKAGSNSVLGMMQSANDEFTDGEKLMEESREAMRKRLDQCTKTLEERASNIQKSTSQALQSLESNVIESKNAISHLVANIKNSLLDLSNTKLEKAKMLDSLVKQWRNLSLANSQSMLDTTTLSSASLKNSIDAFQKEMHNHEAMKTSLENQRSFINNTGSAHVQTIDEQNSLLKAHRQNLAESHDIQSRIRNEVMQSIMSGVQSLVSSEIEKLAKSQMNQFQVLDKDGIGLCSTNERMTQSANQLMENMTLTNQLVSDKASIVCNNDLRAGEAMQSSQNTLEAVIESSSAHCKLTADFASKGLDAVSEMKHIDEQNSEVVKLAEQNGKATSASLVNAVLKPTRLEMKNVLQTSVAVMAYVSGEVVPNVNRDLADVAESRKCIASQIGDKFESASSQLSNVTGQVASMAKAQHNVVEKLGNETLDASHTHANESVPYYYAELDSGKEKLLSTMSNLTESSTHAITEGQTQGSIVKQSMEDFAENKMQCTKPVDPAPSRKECNFSHNLSSTPAEDEILKEIAFDTPSPSGFSTASSTTTATRGPESPILADADTSQESQDEDVMSRKSSGSSSSLPSPRLKLRDINANHGDSGSSKLAGLKSASLKSTGPKSVGSKSGLKSLGPKSVGPKSRKPHRLTANKSSVSRKNKCPPSGQLTPSKSTRKRTKR